MIYCRLITGRQPPLVPLPPPPGEEKLGRCSATIPALGPWSSAFSSKPRTATHILGFYRGPSARELRGVPGSFASESLLQHGAGWWWDGMGWVNRQSDPFLLPAQSSLSTKALVAPGHNKAPGAVPCRPIRPTVPLYRVSCLPSRFRAWRRRSLLLVRHVGSGLSDPSYTRSLLGLCASFPSSPSSPAHVPGALPAFQPLEWRLWPPCNRPNFRRPRPATRRIPSAVPAARAGPSLSPQGAVSR